MPQSSSTSAVDTSKRLNRWALAAGIVLVGYGILVAFALLLWAELGTLFPDAIASSSTLAAQLPSRFAAATVAGSPLAAVAALVLSIVGLVRSRLNRVGAVVTLVIAALVLVPTVFVAQAAIFFFF